MRSEASEPKSSEEELEELRQYAARLLAKTICPLMREFPYGGFSPVRLEGSHIRRDLPEASRDVSRQDPAQNRALLRGHHLPGFAPC